jgi:hypothetical protein
MFTTSTSVQCNIDIVSNCFHLYVQLNATYVIELLNTEKVNIHISLIASILHPTRR